MVTVLHALDEVTDDEREHHIQYWHGTIHPRDVYDDDDEHPIVCWCGARRYDMSDTVCVVWHKATYRWFVPDDLEGLFDGPD